MKLTRKKLRALIESYIVVENSSPVAQKCVDILSDYVFAFVGDIPDGMQRRSIRQDWDAFQILKNNNGFAKLKNPPVYFSINEVDSINSWKDLDKKNDEFFEKYKDVLYVDKNEYGGAWQEGQTFGVTKIPVGNKKLTKDDPIVVDSWAQWDDNGEILEKLKKDPECRAFLKKYDSLRNPQPGDYYFMGPDQQGDKYDHIGRYGMPDRPTRDEDGDPIEYDEDGNIIPYKGNVNESLSRGSLYRRRYWGRY